MDKMARDGGNKTKKIRDVFSQTQDIQGLQEYENC